MFVCWNTMQQLKSITDIYKINNVFQKDYIAQKRPPPKKYMLLIPSFRTSRTDKIIFDNRKQNSSYL